MNSSNYIARMTDALEKDMRSREDSLDELKECTSQLKTLNQRLLLIGTGLLLVGGSSLGIGVVQNQNIEDLPKEIPKEQVIQIVPPKVPRK
jgi:hypothetical protein